MSVPSLKLQMMSEVFIRVQQYLIMLVRQLPLFKKLLQSSLKMWNAILVPSLDNHFIKQLSFVSSLNKSYKS